MYFDNNATTRIDPRVLESMMPYLTSEYGNPSSLHYELGRTSHAAIATSRSQISAFFEKEDSCVTFFSCATESINYVIQGAVKNYCGSYNNLPHIITSEIEHIAVLATCRALEENNLARVTYLPFSIDTTETVQNVCNEISSDTVLVTLMQANNEVGFVNPIAQVADAVKKINPKILFHTDASQSIGKIPFPNKCVNIDFVTIAGHKIYGPKGIAALLNASATELKNPFLFGGGQEAGKRPGTENVPYIVALGKAIDVITTESMNELKQTREVLRNEILNNLPEDCVKVNSDCVNGLPNTLSISFKNLQARHLLSYLEGFNVLASATSACHTSGGGGSYVLNAIKVPAEFISGTIRLSTGRFNAVAEAIEAAKVIVSGAKVLSGVDKSCTTKKLYYYQSYDVATGTGMKVTAVFENIGAQLYEDARHIVTCNKTIFHPQGGGQPSDVGVMTMDGAAVFKVSGARVLNSGGVVFHFGNFINNGSLNIGDVVDMEIDQSKRMINARTHSAGHLLDAAIKDVAASLVPNKGYHFPDGAPFVEYSGTITKDLQQSLPEVLTTKCMKLITSDCIESKVYNDLTSAEAREIMKDCEGCVPDSDGDASLRIVSVAGISCLCGGTHVNNTSDIKGIKVTKISSKRGKTKVYYNVS